MVYAQTVKSRPTVIPPKMGVTVPTGCKSFQASKELFNTQMITGNDVCENNRWGKCFTVLAKRNISYSYDQRNAFLSSLGNADFVDCGANLKSHQSEWKEVGKDWNPFDKPLYVQETDFIAGGSVLCCQ